MALPAIDTADFVGYLKIVANEFKSGDLTQYIFTFREQYLREIVGAAAYQDITNQTRQKWTDLLDGVNYIDVNGERQYLEGLTKSLLRFIYFEFVRDNFTATQVGRVKGKSENSERANDIEIANVARSRYNNGIALLASTPPFLEANKKFEEEITASVDNMDGTYTLSIPNTKYLEVEDFITVSTDNGFLVNVNSYEVTAVTDNQNITIQVNQIGLDFTGNQASWEPFADVRFCLLEPSPI